jgi:hypothetical protein
MHVLFGEILCLHDDAWFYDIACVGSLKWVLVYCASYICNNISCLVGFFFCASHIIDISLSTWSSGGHRKKKMKPTPTSQCYCHSHHLEVSVEDSKTSLYFISHLMLAFIPPSSLWWRPQQPTKKKIEDSTPINKSGRPPTYLGSNVLVYLPPTYFFFLRILGRDSI